MIIDHIGYLCRNIYKSVEGFEALGYHKITDIINDNQSLNGNPPRNVLLCFLQNNNSIIELVAPDGVEPSVVTNQLQRQGEGPYHICYRVEDITTAVKNLKEDGWITVVKPTPAVAFKNSPVVFMFRNSVGLIELVEEYER